jgi:hypothetical protein
MLQRGAVPPLNFAPGLSASNALSAPAGVCPNCWRVWLAGSKSSIGYCWHGKIAWRSKSGALAVAPGVTRDEHRAMLKYATEIESVTRLSPSDAPLGG